MRGHALALLLMALWAAPIDALASGGAPPEAEARRYERRAPATHARLGPSGPDDRRGRRSLALLQPRRPETAERIGRRAVDPRSGFVRFLPAQIPDISIQVTFDERLTEELSPLWSQLIPALFFFLLLTLWQRYSGSDREMLRRCKAAHTAFIIYFTLVGAVLLTGLYVPGMHRTLHLISVFVLVLGIIQVLTVLAVDGFLARARGIHIPVIVRDVTVIVLYLVASIIALSNFGVDLTGILTGSVVLTAVIGLAFQDTLGSIASGLALQVEQPFQVDDWIRFGDVTGRVVEINWRSTKLETLANETIHIPNKEITGQMITNWSGPEPFHRHSLGVGLPYSVAPNRCKSLLEQAARTEGVLPEPPPYAVLSQFGDSSMVYTVHYFISDISQHLRIEDRVRTNVWYRLQREGIPIPFPIRDITVHEAPVVDEAAAEHESVEARARALQTVAFLAPLDPDTRAELARHATVQTFGAGESVIHQGDRGDSLFIVESGELEVLVEVSGIPRPRRVTLLGAGDVFGEMSLMTGERRTATLRTLGDSTLFVIDHQAFARALSGHEELLEQVARVFAERRSHLDEQRQALSTTESAAAAVENEEPLLDRIRSFLGL